MRHFPTYGATRRNARQHPKVLENRFSRKPLILTRNVTVLVLSQNTQSPIVAAIFQGHQRRFQELNQIFAEVSAVVVHEWERPGVPLQRFPRVHMGFFIMFFQEIASSFHQRSAAPSKCRFSQRTTKVCNLDNCNIGTGRPRAVSVAGDEEHKEL